MHPTKPLLVLLFIAASLTAGCGGSGASAPTAGAYGSNNTMDPGDITGAGTSGNVSGQPGFARGSTSQPAR